MGSAVNKAPAAVALGGLPPAPPPGGGCKKHRHKIMEAVSRALNFMNELLVKNSMGRFNAFRATDSALAAARLAKGKSFKIERSLNAARGCTLVLVAAYIPKECVDLYREKKIIDAKLANNKEELKETRKQLSNWKFKVLQVCIDALAFAAYGAMWVMDLVKPMFQALEKVAIGTAVSILFIVSDVVDLTQQIRTLVAGGLTKAAKTHHVLRTVFNVVDIAVEVFVVANLFNPLAWAIGGIAAGTLGLAKIAAGNIAQAEEERAEAAAEKEKVAAQKAAAEKAAAEKKEVAA